MSFSSTAVKSIQGEEVSTSLSAMAPGQILRARITVEEHAAALDSNIPVILKRGAQVHPTVMLIAGLHGDEFEAVHALQDVLDELADTDLDGSIVVLPVANQLSTALGQRLLPTDFSDPNRAFPGDRSGTLVQRLAAAIMAAAMQSDFVYSLHSWSATGTIVPHVEVGDHSSGALAASQNAALALGLPYVLQTAWPTGLLVHQLHTVGIPAVEAEIGGHGMSTVAGRAMYARSIYALLSMQGVIQGAPKELDASPEIVRPVDIRINSSGIVRLLVELGETVSQGDVLAKVRDPFGDVLEEVVSPADGVIGTVRTLGALPAGDRVFTLFVRCALVSPEPAAADET